MSDKWLTVSQAAQQLGISERQARRYAAKLAPEDKDTAPDMEADIETPQEGQGSAARPARRPARVRLAAMQAARDEATRRENSSPTLEIGAEPPVSTPGHEIGRAPDAAPDAVAESAGHETAAAPAAVSGAPADWQERTVEYREQIQFLRAAVEQHQRSEAELRAALRKALEATPRQLIGGAESPASTASAPPTVTNSPPPVASASVPGVAAHPTAAKAPAPTRQTQKHRAVRELLRAFFGIGNAEE